MKENKEFSQTEVGNYESLKYFNEIHVKKIEDFIDSKKGKDSLLFANIWDFLDNVIKYINKKEVLNEEWIKSVNFLSYINFREAALIGYFEFFSPLDVSDKDGLGFNLFSFFVEILKKYNYNLSKNDDIKDKIYLELLEHDKKILDDKKLINQIYGIKEEVTEILEK